VPRNFDDVLSDDLEFVVRGETFRMAYVRPEVLAEWEDEEDADESAAAAVTRLDKRVLAFMHPDDRDRWTLLRAREEAPVPFVQLREILRWMVETQSNRPTETPSVSAGGRGRTAASSSARSSSREAIPAT